MGPVGALDPAVFVLPAGKRAVTADTGLRLCRLFGLSDGRWLRLQASYDTAIARKALWKKLEKITPLKKVA
jgi:plasmid maintenance system antidote protein VapI